MLAAAATHDGSQPQATIPGFFKYHTIVSVTAQGTIHRETVFGPFGYPDYGPLGTGAAPGDGAVWIKQTTSNDPAVAIPAESFTADFQNTVAYGRNGSAALPSNTNPSCGNKYIANDPDCLAFSSVEGTRLSYTAYEVTLNGTSDANSVASNTLVRFDISPSQTSINGFSVHTDASEWQWTPDDPQYGGSVPIACNGGLHCELFVVHSGRMSARAYTNGRMHFLRGPGSPN